ncbi:VOC family protein [Saccharothrix violaceirubra]|uniref:VOC domain-containing protein n=1 Tax=Saccharothrix violaceirubra TaxID=413306 RepID=A0A7W7T3W0_9PSEU|nr:VOC family protein [Saccharothrix violaceirubra]MBB4966036.1 hypothetical protein [Saccharothrix violaceirubra]
MLTTDYLTGVPNWLDLGSTDVERSAAYYTALLDWTHEPLGPEAGGYGFFRHDGRIVAAIGPSTEPGAWTVHLNTPDADATAGAVRAAGGEVRVEPDDVFTAGRLAAFTDPTGAEFAVWQPGDRVGLDAVTVPGSLAWIELHTTDVAAAVAFYTGVFDAEASKVPFSGGEYTVLTPRGAGDERSFAGVVPVGDGRSRWVAYIEVTDVEATFARNTELGGGVLMPVEHVPGVGRMAWLTDPLGTVFAVIQSSTD